MNRLVRSGLAILGLALVSPGSGFAQDASSTASGGYQPYQPPMGLDGKPMAAPVYATAPAPAPASAMPNHQHKGKKLCAKCMAAQNGGMPGKIVGCAHSKNGVCTACQAVLNMPGQVVMMGSSSGEAPGRAVASAGMKNPSDAQTAMYDGPGGEPTPIGVVKTGFSQPNAMPMSSMPMSGPMMGAPSNAPGRAMAESGAGPAPYRPKGSMFPHPHIIGHIIGFSGIGAERADDIARRKSEAHAAIPYNNEGTTINELPASAVFGRR